MSALFLAFAAIPTCAQAQESAQTNRVRETGPDTPVQGPKPKVALVLSGGGAKGLAHIPLLQAMDSLGIVPDLIVGTSMGGVVGGLYAMGYSGDSIARIAESANWDDLLGGNVGLAEVAVEEKSEFRRYLLEFDVVNQGLNPTSALLNDQNLREYLNDLCFPVRTVEDFDNLPIPFRAIATDLLQGREVVINSGSLARALRATMSIPSIFEPVEYGDALLVDGGVQNNFPVDVARQLGADIVIGSDVGGGLLPREKLNSISTILFQTSMMNSNVKNEANRSACDILIDHIPNLTYSTSDFSRGMTIYQEGFIGLEQQLTALDSVAGQLRQYRQLQPVPPARRDSLFFDSIVFTGISERNQSLVRARAGLHPQTAYHLGDILAAEDRIMGTRRYHRVTHRIGPGDPGSVLYLDGVERAKNMVSGTIHYDTNRGVGLVANYTGRNLLITADRMLVSMDIAEEPKFRLQYQFNFSDERNWWVRTEAFGERFIQNYIFNGTLGEDLKNQYFKSHIEFNRNLNTFKDYVGVDMYFEYFHIRPRTSVDVSNNIYDLERYNWRTLEVSAHYRQNTQDRVFFPTHGTRLEVRAGTSLGNRVRVEFNDNSAADYEGSVNGFSRAMAFLDQRLRLGPQSTLILDASAAFTFLQELQPDEIPYPVLGLGSFYFLGGNLQQPKRGSVVFPGLDDSELLVSQFIKLGLAWQYSPWKDFYLVPHLNYATVGFEGFSEFMASPLFPDGDWRDISENSILVSGGSTFAYHSILGPIQLDFSFINRVNRFRVFFSAGIMLNIDR